MFEEGYTFKILNEQNPRINIELTYINQVIGGYIDRRKNADCRQVNVSALKSKKHHYKVFLPKSLRERVLPMNVEMVVKLTTNLKLDVIDKNGYSMINTEDHSDDEIHYLRFESVYNEIELNPSALLNIRNKLNNSDVNFTGWTITDIDRYLNDNPHV